MTDNMTPQLTLDPTAAAAEAVPTLTLTPEAPEAPPGGGGKENRARGDGRQAAD